MADDPKVTANLLEMYGKNDLVMRVNFWFFLQFSGMNALPRESKIMDCGCAMGHLILKLNASGFKNVAGLDASAEMAEQARALTGAQVFHADALELADRVAPSSMDVVIVSDLFHHLDSTDKWEALLAACHKVLRPGGHLVIREPYPTLSLRTLYWMSGYKIFYVGFLKARLQSFVEEDGLLRYFFAHWLGGYKEMLAKAGFTVTRDFSWTVHRITTCVKPEGRP